MKKFLPISVLLAFVAGCVIYSNASAPPSPEKQITDRIAAQADTFSNVVNQFLTVVKDHRTDSVQLRKLFLESRLAYKRFEWAAEYFTPVITRAVNGAPVPEAEMTGLSRQPAGLQVIESDLYPTYNISQRTQLIFQAKTLIEKAAAYKSYFQRAVVSEPQIAEAAKLQVFRVMALGITAFDCQLSQSGLKESAVSLNAVAEALQKFQGSTGKNALSVKFAATEGYLNEHTNFDKFNRAEFILSCGNPLSETVAAFQRQINSPPVPRLPQLLRQNTADLFDADAFDAGAFSINPGAPTKEQIALGKKLFNDPQLSGALTRSCASCHQAKLAYADGLVKNTTVDGSALLKRNTPTLLNAAFQPAFFDDMRETTLEDQAKAVIENKLEMHGSLTATSERLSKDSSYIQLFATAYPKNTRAGIGPKEITGAIVAYVRTLSKLDSRFDEYMRGNQPAMNADEVNGFNVFMGKAKCGTCHYMPLFNGSLPPLYGRMDAEIIGVPADAKGTKLDEDEGRNGISHSSADNHAFKTPSVRNAARTAPYMHNGVFVTLEEVIEFYNKGGGAGLGLKVPNQTLGAQPLNLTDKEKADLVAFIKCLDNK